MSSTPLVWLDCEMTGLNPDHDYIIEIATVITDSDLNILHEGPSLAIHQPEAVLSQMDEWNTTHHTASGLVERVKASRVTTAAAEEATLKFLSQFVAPKTIPLCGNSIWQDRRFLCRHMPKLEAFFHYRNIDVSTIKELARRWAPQLVESLNKESKHLALDDIKESIEELRFYRQQGFVG